MRPKCRGGSWTGVSHIPSAGLNHQAVYSHIHTHVFLLLKDLRFISEGRKIVSHPPLFLIPKNCDAHVQAVPQLKTFMLCAAAAKKANGMLGTLGKG